MEVPDRGATFLRKVGCAVLFLERDAVNDMHFTACSLHTNLSSPWLHFIFFYPYLTFIPISLTLLKNDCAAYFHKTLDILAGTMRSVSKTAAFQSVTDDFLDLL